MATSKITNDVFGINTNNLILDNKTSTTYTATEDCWYIISGYATTSATHLAIDGGEDERNGIGNQYHFHRVPLRKGQTVEARGFNSINYIHVYGAL